jgi:hypothetical protein
MCWPRGPIQLHFRGPNGDVEQYGSQSMKPGRVILIQARCYCITSLRWNVGRFPSHVSACVRFHRLDVLYRRADNFRMVPFAVSVESESVLRTYLVCREKQEKERERERNSQTARWRSTQCTNNSYPISSTSELLLRQNSVTAHAHQS